MSFSKLKRPKWLLVLNIFLVSLALALITSTVNVSDTINNNYNIKGLSMNETIYHHNLRRPPINLTVNEAQTMFVQGSIRFFREQKHKLLYCFIPKNACTMFKTLFYAMINNISPQFMEPEKIHYKVIKYKPPNALFVADKLLNDEKWRSLVILRDPLERLVSGYIDKCIGNGVCEGSTNKEFRDFVDRVLYKINRGKLFNINPHYRPQHTFCGLNKYFEYFDYVIYYQRESIANDTLRFMEDAGIDDYYYNWGPYHNETMFVRKTHHANKVKQTSLEDKILFYSKYYDKELAMRAINAFQTDYKRFKLSYPKWLSAINMINRTT